MSSKTSLLNLLKQSPSSRILPYSKGEIIFQPASDSDEFFVIVSGYVKCYMIDKNGEMNTLIIYSTGEMFPLYWIIGRSNNVSAYFCALSNCKVLKISQAETRVLMEARADVANAMLQQLGEQFAIYATRVGTMSLKYGRERLAHRLLFLAYRFGKKVSGTEHTILPPFSQQDIGATINMARENVSRELSKLERKGIIRHEGNQIVITDQVSLRAQLDMDKELYFDG